MVGMATGPILRIAYALSLAGGLLILLGGVSAAIFGGLGLTGAGSMHMMMRESGFEPAAFGVFSAWIVLGAAFAGALVLYAAVNMARAPEESQKWGTVALVAAVASLLFMGGFVVGAVLAAVGGLLAIVGEGPTEPAAARVRRV